MKVLFISNNSAGTYMFRHEVIEAFTKKADVFLCMPKGRFMEYWEKIGCTFIPCNFDRHGTNPLQDLKQLSEYKRILDYVNPDICFTYTIKPNVYGGMACASRSIPYVANITGLGTAVENGGFMQKVSLLLYKRGLRKAQKVFFQNSENRDFMLSHRAVRSAYELLPGSGVNIEQYQVVQYPDDETTRFAFVSRIMREKGIEQYLQAASEIKKRHEKVEFHIFGFCEQEYEAKLKEMHEQGIIIYHGRASEMDKVYGMASCTVHPTFYPEGMSNVLLESCACGRPIITTDRAGCREVVEDGINGFVVKQKDSADLIEKIEKFLSLPWEQRRDMGLAGRHKVEREFDRQIVVDRYLAQLDMLDGKH